MQLYISLDYYFVYAKGKLHRVSRESGRKEESIDVGSPEKFALCGRNLYYIGETAENGSVIFKTPAADFSQGEVYFYRNNSNSYYDLITSDGENLYSIARDMTDPSYTDFSIFDNNSNVLFDYDLTSWASSRSKGGSCSISNLNALGNRIAFIYSDEDETDSLYFCAYSQSDSEKSFDSRKLTNGSKKTYVEYYDGKYIVDYYNIDKDNGLYYFSYE